MSKDKAYYLSKGFDPAMAEYFAGGRKTITSVKPNEDFTLTLWFDGKEARVYDAKPLFSPGSVFAPLADYSNFRRVYLDECHCVSWDINPDIDSNIDWGNKLDLSPEACYIDSRPVEDGGV